MKIRILRPLCSVTVTYLLFLILLFISAGYGISPILSLAVGGFLFLCLLLPPVRAHLSIRPVYLCLLLVSVLFSGVNGFRVLHRMEAYRAHTGETVTLCASVDRLYYATDNGAAMWAELISINGERAKGRVQITSDAFYAAKDEIFVCQAEVLPFGADADTVFDRMYAFSKGTVGSALITDEASFSVIGEQKDFSSFCYRIAEDCRIRLMQYLPKEDAALAEALLFGDKTDLSPRVERDFRRLGLSHMLAVSGMHFSVLLGVLEGCMRRMGIHKRVRMALLLAFVILFCGVSGFSPSVLRAGIMWSFTFFAFTAGGVRDPITALFGSVLLICLVTPTAVFDVGLILSAMATLGLLTLGTASERWIREYVTPSCPLTRRLIQGILSALALTVSATIFTLPVTLFVFGEYSLMSPPANLVLGPFMSLLLLLIPLFLLISLIPLASRFPAVLLARLIDALASAALWLTETLSGLGQVLIGVRYPFLLPVFAGFVLTALYLVRKKRSFLPLYGTYLACMAIFGVCLFGYRYITRNDAEVYAAVYHKNDIVCVQSRGDALMIDTSDGSKGYAGAAWELISAHNITELDCLMLTHYHNKHRTMIAHLAEETVLYEVLLPVPETEEETEICASISAFVQAHEIKVSLYARGTEEIAFGNARIRVMPRATLSRSVQPIIGYTVYGDPAITAKGHRVTYLCGAGADPDIKEPAFIGAREEALTHGTVLFIGIHGPKIKTSIGEGILPQKRYALIVPADETVTGMLSPTVSAQADRVLPLDGVKYITVPLT